MIDEYKKYGAVSHTAVSNGSVGIIKYKVQLKHQPIGLIEVDKYEGAAGNV